MSEMYQEVDLESQRASLPAVPANGKIRIVRQLSYHRLKLVELQSIAGRDSIAAEKSPSLSRVSSSKSAASAVIGNSNAVQTAITLEMDSACETDLEAQIAPLLRTPDHNMRSKSRLTIIKVIRIVQIYNRFRNIGNASTEKSPSVSRLPSERQATYEIMDSSTTKETDPETWEACASTSTSAVTSTSALLQSRTGNTGIGLQNLQRANISHIVNEKNLKALNDFGGIRGVADALNTHLDNGITPGETDQITDTAPQIQPFPYQCFHFIQEACNDATIYLLSLAAGLSLGFGIKVEGPKDGWSDGAIIVLTIILLVTFKATRQYRHERARYNSAKQEVQKEKKIKAHVVRGGDDYFISDLVCGDIVLLKKGYQVPADGVFISGQDLELDDGSKFVGETDYEKNPFLFHGVRVINGNGRMIATAVGMDTKWSKMMSEGACSPHAKLKLEAHLDKVTTCINIIGLLITIIIFIVTFVQFVHRKLDSESGFKSDSKGEPTAIRTIINTFEKILIEPKGSARGLLALLSVSLVGIVDGIPFVVSVAIFYWNQKTFTGNVTERDSKACLKMASATVICTGIFGGLTDHGMEVHSFSVGREVISESSMIKPNVLHELCDGLSTLALLDVCSSCCGMKEPLLSWAEKKLGMRNKISHTDLVKCKGQNPEVEPCGALIQINGKKHLHWKGPMSDILSMCSHYYDSEGEKHPLEDERMQFEKDNRNLQERQMKTIAFASGISSGLQDLETTSLTLVGLIGLKNTNQEDVKTAIEACRIGGVKTILVSADDVSDLEAIALQCSLLTPNSDGVLKGQDFQNFLPHERMQKLDTIRVLGNSSTEHKQLLVKCLREKGEVVAMIGQRTDDAPALRRADVGVTTGTWSSVPAREVSNITIWESDFVSAIDMIKSGRCIYGNIQKFVQLELIMNISSVLINVIGTVSLGDSPITPIRFFWLNLLLAFLGGLAILTGPPARNLMSMPPVSPSTPLVTKAMIRNIVLQTIYQVSILAILQHQGSAILGNSHAAGHSMIFNSYVLCQFFNQFNARELQEKNFFAGISRHHWFWIALGAFVELQAIFVVFDQTLMKRKGLNWKLWAVCFLIGVASWLVDYVGKLASSFINIDWPRQCMNHLARKCESFLIIGPHSDYDSMGIISSATSETGPNLKHPLMSRNSTTIPPETHTLD